MGIRIPEQDAHAAARGNAFTATADNPSAVYYNPAGVTQLEGQNVSLGAMGIVMNSEYEQGDTSLHTKREFQAVPELYYTLKTSKLPVSFGLGLYSPYGLGLEWPEEAPFTALSRKGKIEYLTFNPVVAWEPVNGLSLGAGPTLNWAKADLRNVPFGLPGSKFRFNGTDSALGFNAGVLWKPLEKHAFGVNYRSSSEMHFRGDADTTVPAFGVDRSEGARADFSFPQHVVVGYSFRPTPKWNLEFDADWTDWDNLNTVMLNKPSGDEAMVFNWRSSWMYQFGVTRYLENNWALSGGYIFSENSVPDESFSPGVPDSDRHIFCVGVGKTFERLSWNATYQLAWGPTRTLENPTTARNALANGSYEFISHALIFNVGYRF